MGTEIERKSLVKGDGWRALAEGVHYRQGYLNSAKEPIDSKGRIATLASRLPGASTRPLSFRKRIENYLGLILGTVALVIEFRHPRPEARTPGMP